MPWSPGSGGGFTEPGVRTWLPMADPSQCNVADQEGNDASVLEFCRRAIAARAASDELAVGSYASLSSPAGTWAYRRGERTTVLVNMSDVPVNFSDVGGTVSVSTDTTLDGSAVEGGLTLPAWTGAVVAD
jgi:glycosidase